jgi:hypothetical protein
MLNRSGVNRKTNKLDGTNGGNGKVLTLVEVATKARSDFGLEDYQFYFSDRRDVRSGQSPSSHNPIPPCRRQTQVPLNVKKAPHIPQDVFACGRPWAPRSHHSDGLIHTKANSHAEHTAGSCWVKARSSNEVGNTGPLTRGTHGWELLGWRKVARQGTAGSCWVGARSSNEAGNTGPLTRGTHGWELLGWRKVIQRGWQHRATHARNTRLGAAGMAQGRPTRQTTQGHSRTATYHIGPPAETHRLRG